MFECKMKKNFNETKYEDLLKIINSEETDLNQFVEEMLTSEPADPSLKRKRVIQPSFTKRC